MAATLYNNLILDMVRTEHDNFLHGIVATLNLQLPNRRDTFIGAASCLQYIGIRTDEIAVAYAGRLDVIPTALDQELKGKEKFSEDIYERFVNLVIEDLCKHMSHPPEGL